MISSPSTARPAIARSLFHKIFDVAILLKGLNGLLELLAGLGFLLLGRDGIGRLATWLMGQELAEDPGDFIFSRLHALFVGLSPGAHAFATVYLLLHGLVKLTLVIGLLQNRRWAYPVASVLFSLFILYTAYRLTHGWSWIMAGLILLDSATVALILHEWRVQPYRRTNSRATPVASCAGTSSEPSLSSSYSISAAES